MFEYELVNPSDKYTFLAPNLVIAACAVLILGEGRYGAHRVDNEEERVPIFLFGGHDVWLKEQGVDDFPEYIKSHGAEISACLDSFLIGSHEDRRRMERVLAEVRDPADRERAQERWHDERRSSMNNIGLVAKRYAKILREKAAKAERPQP
jgi:hypothetical protein